MIATQRRYQEAADVLWARALAVLDDLPELLAETLPGAPTGKAAVPVAGQLPQIRTAPGDTPMPLACPISANPAGSTSSPVAGPAPAPVIPAARRERR